MTSLKTLAIAGAISLSSFAAIASETPTVGGTILGVKVDIQGTITKGYRASHLIGSQVQNDKKEAVGFVQDLILSNDGKVNLAIIEVGGFIGIGAKYVAVPAHLFTDVQSRRVTLPGITEKKLKDMPAFQYAS